MKYTPILMVGAALTVGTIRADDLAFAFDTDVQGFGAAERGTPVWSGANGGSVQADAQSSGWAWTIKRAFDETERGTIASFGAAGTLSFDIVVDHSTGFGADGGTTSDWFQINLLGNSSAGGWQQLGNIFSAGGWHDMNDTSTVSQHLTFDLATLGLDKANDWSEIQFGQNSGALPVNFYVDNVQIAGPTPVPEPATFALVGFGALALCLRRPKA